MTIVELQVEDSSGVARVDVRCGVCRDRSLDRTGTRRADLLGHLRYGFDRDGTEAEWEYLGIFRLGDTVTTRQLEGDHPLSRMAFTHPETWKTEPFMPTEDFTGIRAQCRHGHDLRVSRDRLATLPISGDGVIYLPGS